MAKAKNRVIAGDYKNNPVVCTCLNPLHTCLAIFGCVLGYDKISEEMKDEQLKKLVETVGYVEGLPVVVNPGVLDPKEFIDTVLNVRVPNRSRFKTDSIGICRLVKIPDGN